MVDFEQSDEFLKKLQKEITKKPPEKGKYHIYVGLRLLKSFDNGYKFHEYYNKISNLSLNILYFDTATHKKGNMVQLTIYDEKKNYSIR